MSRLFPMRTRFQRDVAEIENYFETYSRRHPGVVCTMLRYQPGIGPSLDTQITRYLSLPVVPTYLGFDPRLQFVHEHDALEALVAAVRNPVRGAVNVAAPGTIGLTRMVRLAGRPTLPVVPAFFDAATGVGRRLGLLDFSDDFKRLLRHGRATDTTRLVEEVGYEPRYGTVEAVADYLRTQGGRRVLPNLRHAVAP
jgi:UDP-glucose 4-epimerase